MLKRNWDIQVSLENYWLSLGFHFDHTDPSLTIHLPILIICLGKCKQPGFKHSFYRWINGIERQKVCRLKQV